MHTIISHLTCWASSSTEEIHVSLKSISIKLWHGMYCITVMVNKNNIKAADRCLFLISLPFERNSEPHLSPLHTAYESTSCICLSGIHKKNYLCFFTHTWNFYFYIPTKKFFHVLHNKIQINLSISCMTYIQNPFRHAAYTVSMQFCLNALHLNCICNRSNPDVNVKHY